MKLTVGLGNPGEKYKGNRHNVGYMLIDELQKQKLPGLIIKKTNVFMNESGKAVKKTLDSSRLSITSLYIVHDDLDIPLGEYKIQFGKGPKVHNGINLIEEELGTKDFWRIRIGIENRSSEPHYAKAPRGEDYVLQDFTEEEQSTLSGVLQKIVLLIKTLPIRSEEI